MIATVARAEAYFVEAAIDDTAECPPRNALISSVCTQ
jgi:hypothetical protein